MKHGCGIFRSISIFLVVAVFSSCKAEVRTVQGDYDPDLVETIMIFYDNPKGDDPAPTSLAVGAKIKSRNLPSVSCRYFNFDGWYLGDQKIEAGYVPSSDITVTARYSLAGYEYDVADVSGFQFKKPSRNELSMEGKTCKIKLTSSGSGNWGFNYPEEYSRNTGVRGVEFDVKVGPKMEYAGIQFFPEGNYDTSHKNSCYDSYYYYITKDGYLTIDFYVSDGSKRTRIYRKKDGVQAGENNRVRVFSKPDSGVEVYLNGKLVHTIEAKDLKFVSDTTFVCWYSKSCSSKEPAEAWIHYLGFQKLK